MRAASLAKHSKLVRNVESFAGQKGLTPVPPQLLENIREGEKRIGEYRDYSVAHEASSKIMRGTGFQTETGETWIMTTRLYPTHERQLEVPPQSESPPALMEWIESYVIDVLAYLVANRDRAGERVTRL